MVRTCYTTGEQGIDHRSSIHENDKLGGGKDANHFLTPTSSLRFAMPLTRLPSRPRNSSRPPQPFSRSPNPSPAPASTATFASAPTRPTHGATKSVSLELGQDWEPNDLEEKLGINEIWNDIDYWEQALSEKGKLISGKTMRVHSPSLPLHFIPSRAISTIPSPKFYHPSPHLSFTR